MNDLLSMVISNKALILTIKKLIGLSQYNEKRTDGAALMLLALLLKTHVLKWTLYYRYNNYIRKIDKTVYKAQA